jgi:hypothetical protein
VQKGASGVFLYEAARKSVTPFPGEVSTESRESTLSTIPFSPDSL